MVNKCKNCGGILLYSPKDKGNICQSCGSLFPVKFIYEFKKKDFSQHEPLSKEEDLFAKSLKNVKCKSCGAMILLNKLQIQSICPYCGNSDLVESRAKNLMYIDNIIPFAFDKTEAIKKFKMNLASRFYANRAVFKGLTEKNLVGSYINAFVFDVNSKTDYSGVFSYTRKIKEGDEEKTITEFVNVSGVFEKTFKNLTIEANSHLTQEELNSIMPFEYGSSVNFVDNFMNGYILEYNDRMFEECFADAEKIIKRDIEKSLLNKYNCDNVVSLRMDVTYPERKYNYCLLPVYFVSSQVKDKTYRVLMNGQTGKVGKLPKNALRIFLTVLFSCGIVVAIILLIALLINM